MSSGHYETNPMPEGCHDQARPLTVAWNTPDLKITRLRLISDPGFPRWDVSYCYGDLDGVPVRVSLPFDQLNKNRQINGQILAFAKKEGLFAKSTGIFDNISTLC